jgi:CRP-like cAMP-binding protein
MGRNGTEDEVTNRFLLALPRAIRDETLSHVDPVEFPKGHIIYRVGAPVEHLYFVNRGLISLVKNMEDGRSIEIGAIGIEGFLGIFALYDDGLRTAIVESMVQIPIKAFAIKLNTLKSKMMRHDAFREGVNKYHYLVVCQLAQNAACNCLHSLEERCCRWLLVASDSALADNFPLTHELLAMLLGVHRPSVSTVTATLQRAGLIRYVHGQVTIVDRIGIEKQACECYRALREQTDHLFG